MRASIDVSLGSAVQGGEIGSDEGGQNMVAPVGHQAVVLRVLHHVLPGWVVLPPVVPAHHRQSRHDAHDLHAGDVRIMA